MSSCLKEIRQRILRLQTSCFFTRGRREAKEQPFPPAAQAPSLLGSIGGARTAVAPSALPAPCGLRPQTCLPPHLNSRQQRPAKRGDSELKMRNRKTPFILARRLYSSGLERLRQRRRVLAPPRAEQPQPRAVAPIGEGRRAVSSTLGAAKAKFHTHEPLTQREGQRGGMIDRHALPLSSTHPPRLLPEAAQKERTCVRRASFTAPDRRGEQLSQHPRAEPAKRTHRLCGRSRACGDRLLLAAGIRPLPLLEAFLLVFPVAGELQAAARLARFPH
ncbi:UNVERIFIED_CONTAM: hypothetical protein K2H54_053880 [Gekko kuhli]